MSRDRLTRGVVSGVGWRAMLSAAVAVVLLGVAGALVERSQAIRDSLWFGMEGASYSLHSHHGQVWFWRLHDHRPHSGLRYYSVPDSYYLDFGLWLSETDFAREPYWNEARGSARTVEWRGFRLATDPNWSSPDPSRAASAPPAAAHSFALYVPHWALMALFSLPPARLLARIAWRWHRARHNRCVNCGYDLRASKERCPECGMTVAGDHRAGTVETIEN